MYSYLRPSSCDCGSASGGAAACTGDSCVCGPVNSPDCECECPGEFGLIKRPLYQDSMINLNANGESLFTLAYYFERLFPGQILLPVSLSQLKVTINLKNVTVREAIARLGLATTTGQLTSYIYLNCKY